MIDKGMNPKQFADRPAPLKPEMGPAVDRRRIRPFLAYILGYLRHPAPGQHHHRRPEYLSPPVG